MECLSMMVGAGVFDDVYKRGDIMSEKEYFQKARINLLKAEYRIAFAGYDKPFMEDPITIQTIHTALNQSQLMLQAIIPEDSKTYLEELAADPLTSSLVTLMKTLKAPSQQWGFILLDQNCVMYWDARKKTHFAPEQAQGVYYREISTNPKTVLKCAENFMELERDSRRYLLRKKN